MRLGLIVAFLLSCTPPPPSPTFSPPAGANRIDGGCGSTVLYQGDIPETLDAAAGNNAPRGIPYALARPPIAAGFVFGYPLHMSATSATANKILWVVATPRGGTLQIDGHPLGAPTPTVHITRAPDSSPGNIFPSEVDVPAPGCWSFTLSWPGHNAEIELAYR